MTLKEILEKHPEWADLRVVVMDPNEGNYHYVSDGPYGSGMLYEANEYDDNENIIGNLLVFTF